jgi:RNA polymerase sigma-70 factor (ECF subfamily)
VASTENRSALETLMAAVANGDRTAFRSLYAETSAKIYGVLVGLLGRNALAEECLQEVYVKVWHSAASYSIERGTVMTWLIAVARHRAIDLKRRERARGTQTALDEAVELADPGSEAAMEKVALAGEGRRLRDCLQQLEEQPRRCLLLAYWRGLTQEELARRLGQPLGTVKSWIRRSLQKLKDCLGP